MKHYGFDGEFLATSFVSKVGANMINSQVLILMSVFIRHGDLFSQINPNEVSTSSQLTCTVVIDLNISIHLFELANETSKGIPWSTSKCDLSPFFKCGINKPKDRGGSTFDGAGYVALLSDLKDAFADANPTGGSWGLSCEYITVSE